MTAAYQATVDSPAVALATMPYALCGVGDHILDHGLPSPSLVDFDARAVTVWLHADHVAAWRNTTDTIGTPRRQPGSGPWDSHTAEAILHGCCVRVTFRWITPWETCEHPDCGDPVAPADAKSYDAGCSHGRDLCSLHRLHCTECVEDLRQDRAEGWVR